MAPYFTDARQSAIRALIRAAVLLVTAWGFDLSADLVAAIQLFAEAALQAAVQLTPTD